MRYELIVKTTAQSVRIVHIHYNTVSNLVHRGYVAIAPYTWPTIIMSILIILNTICSLNYRSVTFYGVTFYGGLERGILVGVIVRIKLDTRGRTSQYVQSILQRT